MMALWACVPPQFPAAARPPSTAALRSKAAHPPLEVTRSKQPFPVVSSLRRKQPPLLQQLHQEVTSWSPRKFHAFARKSSVVNWRSSRPTGSSLKSMMILFFRSSLRSQAVQSLRKCTCSSATVRKSLKEATPLMGINSVKWCPSLWLNQSV